MKAFYLFALGAMFAATTVCAQTTARDWSRADCDGNQHSLYSELDGGKVIIMEFIMLNCSPCISAVKGLKNVAASFEDSHPDRVHLYSIGYSDDYTCEQLQQWRWDSGAFNTVLAGGSADIAYYGGMGMPTVVIAGGKSHKVYYAKQGYVPGDNTAIKQAIALALAESTTDVSEDMSAEIPAVFPNPAEDEVSISFGGRAVDYFVVLDATGRELTSEQVQVGSASATVSTRQFAPGAYSVRLMHAGQVVHSAAFIARGR